MGLFTQLQNSFARAWSVPEDDADMEYMTSVSEALLQKSPHGQQLFIKILGLLVFTFVLWAVFATVDEFTRGFGKVIPSQDIQVVQNLEGGILAELLVSEGQLVEKGKPLMRLDDTRFSSSFRENTLQLDYLKLKAARLQAEADGSTDFFSSMTKSEFYSEEKALFDSRQQEKKSELTIMRGKVMQKNQELKELEQGLHKLQKSYELLEKEYRLTKPLIKKGAVSEVEVIRLERSLGELEGEVEGVKLSIPRLKSELDEAKENVTRIDDIFKTEARTELNETLAKISQIEETSGALGDRVDRTIVRAPVKGTVKQIKIKTVGGVVQPGMDLLEMVPFEDKLHVEVQVSPTDIAFIHPGQKASVKVTAYDFSIHGDLKGEVIHISPDTIKDEEGRSFYVVRVQTEGAFFKANGDELPIIPGMTVEVNILTGKKTIMAYLLKPILKTKSLAFRER